MDVQLGTGTVSSLAESFIPCENYSTAVPNLFILQVSKDVPFTESYMLTLG